MTAVEVLLNTQLVSEMVAKGDFTGVKEALEKSMAEGSQSYEQDIARLINEGIVTRDEGLIHADSPTNLMWRLQNDMGNKTKLTPKAEVQDEGPSFTEITLDVHNDDGGSFSSTRF